MFDRLDENVGDDPRAGSLLFVRMNPMVSLNNLWPFCTPASNGHLCWCSGGVVVPLGQKNMPQSSLALCGLLATWLIVLCL